MICLDALDSHLRRIEVEFHRGAEVMGGGQLGRVSGVSLAEHAEHAACRDGAVLCGVADEPEAGAGGGGHAHERVEVAVRQR